jgi:hypothetical protein
MEEVIFIAFKHDLEFGINRSIMKSVMHNLVAFVTELYLDILTV